MKNTTKVALVDDHVYDWLKNKPEFKEDKFLENLRLHSSGCAVFQKTTKVKLRVYETKTLYLHKVVAEQFLTDEKTEEKPLVSAVNGDKLDCRLENLVYRSHSEMSRLRKSSSKTGYKGVYQEHKKFRSVITIEGKSFHLGMFKSAEAASDAYNQKLEEVYGADSLEYKQRKSVKQAVK